MIEAFLTWLLGESPSGSAVEALGLGLSVLAGVLGYLLVSRPAARQALRVEQSQAYMGLELASIETFKYRAAHWKTIAWTMDGHNRGLSEAQLSEEADQYAYQCLNLFEVASRFRNTGIIDKQIYGSWVAWFYEMLEVAYFREQWSKVYVDNYTIELQDIFNAGVALWIELPDPPEGDGADYGEQGDPGTIAHTRRMLFYQRVGLILDCPIIYFWLDENMHKAHRWRQWWSFRQIKQSGQVS